MPGSSVPAVIVVRPSPLEYGLHHDAYDAFVEGLRAKGLDARLEEPVERRSVGQEALEVGVWLAEHGASAAVDLAVLEVIRRVARATIGRARQGRKQQAMRRLPIYDGDGEVHGWIELPADDETS